MLMNKRQERYLRNQNYIIDKQSTINSRFKITKTIPRQERSF